ncbi:60S ribosomal protein L4-A [Galendromus occidentalis]|uniref:60S ribosomal protein L4-A n=1 Tax=Galendromus occidentalis TaxID=34638 RepID=A0AAJ6QM34_9ACAR|nr:60S ribosomal protein L4-A [Galendromus occidentalis]
MGENVCIRPLATVYAESNEASGTSAGMPAVFRAPIRPDLISFVHHQLLKNKRTPYAVSKEAGHQTSAESWGTGRAVARIPRVRGGGTHRSGQGAFGNMCRGGRMFAPTKTWRRWHRRVNVTQRRHAAASAVSASGVTALVMAKGHAVEQINELPLVVADKVQDYQKTKQAVNLLKSLKAWSDVEKVYQSKRLRPGKGKRRNRRYKKKCGPLVVYEKDNGIVRAFRNIPGVDTCNVNSLSIFKLAPGGHAGRFIIWTEAAFRKLNDIFGTFSKASKVKKAYKLPRAMMTITDIGRLQKSEEIRAAFRKSSAKSIIISKKEKPNPLKNPYLLDRLNPFAIVEKRSRILKLKEEAGKNLKKPRALEKMKATKRIFKKMNASEKTKLKRLSNVFPKNRGAKSKKGGKKVARATK